MVILPTIIIGMYGAIYYAEASTSEFLGGVLLGEQHEISLLLSSLVCLLLPCQPLIPNYLLWETKLRLLGLKEDDNLRPVRLVIFFRTFCIDFSLVSLMSWSYWP